MGANVKDALVTLLAIPEPERTPDVNIIIAAISTSLGDFPQADRALIAVEATAPTHPELAPERARWLLEVGDTVASIDLCTLTLAQAPTHAVMVTILLDGLFRAERFADAVKTYVAFKGAVSLEMAVIAARSAMRTNAPNRAVEILDSQLEMTSPMPDAHYLRAQLAFLDKDIPKAIAHLERACTLAPNLFEAVNQLIHSYLELNQWDQAIPWINQLIGRNPGDAEQHFRLSMAYEGVGNIDKAIESIDTAIGLDSNSAELSCAKAGIWIRNGKIKDAMILLKELVGSHGKNPIVYQTLGIAFQHQDRWDDAVKAFKKALELGGDDPVVYAAMGTAYLALGQPQFAKDAFTKAGAVGGGAEFTKIASTL